MARISNFYVSNFDQSKELTFLANNGKSSSTTGLFHPPVAKETH